MEPIPQWMLDHERTDNERFDKIATAIALLPTKEDLSLLATESSVRDLIHWQKNIVIAGQVLTTSGKWGYRAVIALASLLVAFGIITGGIKAFLIWLISRFI